MKKFSLFVLGIIFCAANVWGEDAIPQVTMTVDETSATGTCDGITYSAVAIDLSDGQGIAYMFMNVTISGYNCSSASVTIPAQISPIVGGMMSSAVPISAIEDGAFSSCNTLTEIYLPTPVANPYVYPSTPTPATVTYENAFPVSVETIYVHTEADKTTYVNAGYPESKITVEAGAGPATSGECGDNLTWEFEDGTLTISGSGAMEDYEVAEYGQPTSAPWAYYITNNLLTEVEIAGTVTTIGNYAFYNCAGLTEISLPSSLTSIGEGAFSHTSLSEIILPSSLQDIYSGAFSNTNINNASLIRVEATTPPTFHGEEGTFPFPVSNLGLTIYVPIGCVSAYQEAWGTSFNNGIITYSDVQNPCGTNLRWEYDQATKTLSFIKVDPNVAACTMNNYRHNDDDGLETSNSPWCMYIYTDIWPGIEHVVLPEGLTNIGDYALYHFDNVESITLPSTLVSIGDHAMGLCSGLTSLTLPNSITSIGDEAFYSCSSLATLTLPSSLESIGKDAFIYNSSLSSITFPASLESIGTGAFSYCSNLAEITVLGETPASIPVLDNENYGYYTASGQTVFDRHVVEGEEDLNIYVYVPVGSIGAYEAAWGTESYLMFVGQKQPQSILHYFNGSCGSDLYWIYNPNTHTLSIEGTGAMTDYTELSAAPWNSYKTAITTIDMPEGITRIGSYAFAGCITLTSASIPAAVTAVGEHAFDGCTSLNTIEVNGNIAIVGENAFDEETQLELAEDVSFNLGDATAEYTETTLNALLDAINDLDEEEKKINMTITRPIQANGNLNTICLPFALSAAQIANSDLAGATIYAFTAEDGVSEEKLLTLSPVTSMQAGVPYFFAYTNNAANTPNLTKLVFNNVLLTTAVEEPVDLDAGTFVLHGTLRPTRLNHASNYLFLGAENSLFYPQLEGTTEAEQTINPFRAYFSAKSGNQAPARFVFGRPTPTDVENVQGDKVQCTKVLQNGQMFIRRGENTYSLDGKRL